MTTRDIAAYLLERAAPYELVVGPWPTLYEIARDIAMGSLEVAVRNGEIEDKHYRTVDQWIGAGEETGPQAKDVED